MYREKLPSRQTKMPELPFRVRKDYVIKPSKQE
jgi:hypothetical protein